MKFSRRSHRPCSKSGLSPRGHRASRAHRPTLGTETLRLEARTLLALSVTTFPTPLVALVQPDGITTGPDGNLWFTESAAGAIGRMTVAGALTQFTLPDI